MFGPALYRLFALVFLCWLLDTQGTVKAQSDDDDGSSADDEGANGEPNDDDDDSEEDEDEYDGGFEIELEDNTKGVWGDYFKAWGVTRFSKYDLCHGMRQVAEKASMFYEIQLAFCATEFSQVGETSSDDELTLYFTVSSLKLEVDACFRKVATELQKIFNSPPSGAVKGNKVNVRSVQSLVIKKAMLNKIEKEESSEDVWNSDREFQLAVINQFTGAEKPKAVYSVPLGELPGSTYVAVFVTTLPTFTGKGGVTGSFEITGWRPAEKSKEKRKRPRMIAQVCDTTSKLSLTVIQLDTIPAFSRSTPISNVQRYVMGLLDNTDSKTLTGTAPFDIDLGQLMLYPPNPLVGYILYFRTAPADDAKLAVQLGSEVARTVIASDKKCVVKSDSHGVLRVAVRFPLPNGNMPLKLKAVPGTASEVYQDILRFTAEYIKYIFLNIHEWENILEATWVYRLELTADKEVIAHGHVDLNVYYLLQKHRSLDWSNIIEGFNNNFMNKFPFEAVGLFVRHAKIACDVTGSELLCKSFFYFVRAQIYITTS
ncbi:hypothetical protein CRM22_010351 [Opisthorchis felineus]|uniref:Uncharacterized protein n=1 Tax=Opisthorchis felineus TaxID=147828 RepID=A0A4S2L4V8_OPIFE|nr:hypothetical protein CRM22_010351 [Opisthorchis felineus]